jgi:hypothetical protein
MGLIINSRKARLGLILVGLVVVALYLGLWLVTGDDDAGQIGAIAVFLLAILVCWACMIRERGREMRLFKRGNSR